MMVDDVENAGKLELVYENLYPVAILAGCSRACERSHKPRDQCKTTPTLTKRKRRLELRRASSSGGMVLDRSLHTSIPVSILLFIAPIPNRPTPVQEALPVALPSASM